MQNNCVLQKDIRKKESYKYLANKIISICEKEKIKILGVTSTNYSCGIQGRVLEKLHDIFLEKNLKVLVINSLISCKKSTDKSPSICSKNKNIITLENYTAKKLNEFLQDNLNDYDIILVSIPSPLLWSEALEYSKVCKNVILIERYMYSLYKDYENLLFEFKNSDVSIKGVVTVR